MSDTLSFTDALRIARGCTDYGGGYRGQRELYEAYQHGIQTVINALEGAESRGLGDSQIRALHIMGGEAAAAAVQAPQEPVAWIRLLSPGEAKLDGRTYDLVFTAVPEYTPLYLAPPGVSELVGALEEITAVAGRVDGWQSFPAGPIDRARAALEPWKGMK